MAERELGATFGSPSFLCAERKSHFQSHQSEGRKPAEATECGAVVAAGGNGTRYEVGKNPYPIVEDGFRGDSD